MIPFNRPHIGDSEIRHAICSLRSRHISGDGEYTKKSQEILKKQLKTHKAFLTTSCTHALEMCAILLDLQPGDEVIVPSYTFTSTALAFVMHGATITFADIRFDTLNIDETKIEELITPRTRAIVVVHYAGVGCGMTPIMEIADRHNLVLVEDNAHGLFGKYKGKQLGTFGDLSTLSFHETKNITCGEGGALIINNEKYIERAEIIREKGTNRSKFFRGQVDKYSWVDKGSSYVMSDILAAILYGQLRKADEIQQKRENIWISYYSGLQEWAAKNDVQLPFIPGYCDQAFHMFYMLMPDIAARNGLIAYLKRHEIVAVFHYIPLHSSVMGLKVGGSNYECPVAEEVSDKLVRLPFFSAMEAEETRTVIDKITNYLEKR